MLTLVGFSWQAPLDKNKKAKTQEGKKGSKKRVHGSEDQDDEALQVWMESTEYVGLAFACLQ